MAGASKSQEYYLDENHCQKIVTALSNLIAKLLSKVSLLAVRVMNEQYDPRTKSFINEQLTGSDYVVSPIQDLTTAEAFRQRWEQDITSRFREARARFPEFFPCFELRDNPQTGLQYSIHFQPLTGHAKALIQFAPQFPHQKEFKPIEQLWNEVGQSELDILFERVPTQLKLKPPKQLWSARWSKLMLRVGSFRKIRFPASIASNLD
jgi:hypothetical protein